MTEPRFRSDVIAEHIDTLGSDQDIVRAARVSTSLDRTEHRDPERFISFLMASRHGTPFEHGIMKFRIEAPIFVVRELLRHRIASVNEMSGRYTDMPADFYLPADDRPLDVTYGKAPREATIGDYLAIPRRDFVDIQFRLVIRRAWEAYEAMLDAGITREVARDILPLGTYTQLYLTINLRSLMNLLSLRIDRPDNAYPTHPLHEIQLLAEQMNDAFAKEFPATLAAFHAAGRVAP